MFKLEYIAASLGVDIAQGGLSMAEEQLTAAAGGIVTPTHTPVAFDGSMIGWYKTPSQSEYTVGTFVNGVMTIADASEGDTYCVKYQYQDENARSVVIPTDYVPSELHVVIISDLFAGGVSDVEGAAKVGRLITDIPRLGLDGSQTLNLTSSSTSTVSLSGSALAVSNEGNSCETGSYYGTMTEEIFGAVWQNNVIALAIENGEMEIPEGSTEKIIVRAVFGQGMASQRKDNSNFTFTIVQDETGTVVVSTDGVVSGGSEGAEAMIGISLTGYSEVPMAYARVEFTA